MKGRDFFFLIVAIVIFAVMFTSYLAPFTTMPPEVESPIDDISNLSWEHVILFAVFLLLNIIAGCFLTTCAFGLFLASISPVIIMVGYALALSILGDTMDQHPNESMMLVYMVTISIYLFAVEKYTKHDTFTEFILDLGTSSTIVIVYMCVMVFIVKTPLTSDLALKWAPMMFLAAMIAAGQLNFSIPFKKTESKSK